MEVLPAFEGSRKPGSQGEWVPSHGLHCGRRSHPRAARGTRPGYAPRSCSGGGAALDAGEVAGHTVGVSRGECSTYTDGRCYSTGFRAGD